MRSFEENNGMKNWLFLIAFQIAIFQFSPGRRSLILTSLGVKPAAFKSWESREAATESFSLLLIVVLPDMVDKMMYQHG